MAEDAVSGPGQPRSRWSLAPAKLPRPFGYMTLGVIVMIDVSVKQTEPMNVAFLSMHAAYSEIPQAMGVLYSFAGERGLRPAGMPRAVYFTPPDGADGASAPDWELWAPVADEVAAAEPDERGLGTKQVPAMLVASTTYKGPYDGIESTYRELGQWIPEHGYEIVGPPMEIYFSDPAEVPPEEYLTEIQFPVEKR